MHQKVTTRLRHYVSVKNIYILLYIVMCNSCGRFKHSKTCNHSLGFNKRKNKKKKTKDENK